MLDDKSRAPEPADPVSVRCRLASLEPTHHRRPCGTIFESLVLGRMEFVSMPHGRSSFWLGRQRMPDSALDLQLICEVENDDLPGVDHSAAVVTIRRHQVKDAASCVPLINAHLREMGLPGTLQTDDLFLTAIHLRARPMLDPRYALEYRGLDGGRALRITVAFERGTPRSVYVDLNA
jgi:hypothetical protein